MIFAVPGKIVQNQMPQSPRMKNPPGRDLKDKPKQKKRGGPKDDDDVDENGNISGLIDYDYESESGESTVDILTEKELKHLKKYGKLPSSVKETLRSPRKAALKAREQIRKKLKKEDSRNKSPTTTDSTYYDKNFLKKKGFVSKNKKKFVESEDEEDGETLGSEDTDTEDEDTDEEEEEEEADEDADEEEEADDEEEEEEEDSGKFNGISINIAGGGGYDDYDRLVPKRHNMKKESEEVRRFVEMVTKPVEENTIDDQIDQFKALESPKKRSMLEALERRSAYVKKEEPLMFRLLQMKLTPETMAMVMSRYNAMNTMDTRRCLCVLRMDPRHVCLS